MAGMRFRTVFGTFIVLGIAVVVLLDACLFTVHRPLGSLLLAAFALAGWRELAAITGLSGQGPKASFLLDLIGGGAVLFFFVVAWSFGVKGEGGPDRQSLLAGEERAWLAGIIASLIILSFTTVIFSENFRERYPALLETIAGALVLGFLFSYVLRIYHLAGWRGPALGSIFIAGVKGNDTAAYYVGKTWGKRRIFKVSPNKTLEGSIGAVIFSVIYFATFGGVMEGLKPGSLFPWYGGILFGMMISLLSQIGDLGESLLKRVYQVKDSGALLPEFGGALDMIDSLLFTGFLFWQLCR